MNLSVIRCKITDALSLSGRKRPMPADIEHLDSWILLLNLLNRTKLLLQFTLLGFIVPHYFLRAFRMALKYFTRFTLVL